MDSQKEKKRDKIRLPFFCPCLLLLLFLSSPLFAFLPPPPLPSSTDDCKRGGGNPWCSGSQPVGRARPRSESQERHQGQNFSYTHLETNVGISASQYMWKSQERVAINKVENRCQYKQEAGKIIWFFPPLLLREFPSTTRNDQRPPCVQYLRNSHSTTICSPLHKKKYSSPFCLPPSSLPSVLPVFNASALPR